jgi:hypothetical protein
LEYEDASLTANSNPSRIKMKKSKAHNPTIKSYEADKLKYFPQN